MAEPLDGLRTTIHALGESPSQVDTALPDLHSTSPEQRLQLLTLLGKGGMGEVWTCQDTNLGRELAFKMATSTEPAAQARFLREARVQGQLEHPGIVPVHELGLREGRPFFVMKRVRGITLAEVLRRLSEGDAETLARFPTHKLVAMVVTLAQTLDFAHARGVVHRDVKPLNIMLGDYGEVYLLDWGIAKVSAQEEPVSSTAATQPAVTLAGTVMGSPGYMAPEQAAGEGAVAASDVWSLGAVLAEVVTLEPMVHGRSSLELLNATVAHVWTPLRECPRSSDVAPELDALCARAVSKNAADRPTARQFADGLDAVLSGQRDLELRTTLAAGHAARAQAASVRALQGDLEARRETLQEIGRALALEPGQSLAQQTFLSLLQTPPTIDPPEVQAELDRFQDTVSARTSRNGFFGYLSIVLFMPLALWMGARDWVSIGAMSAAWAFLVGVNLWVVLRRPTPGARLIATIATALLGIAQSWVLGPFMIIPSLATSNAMALTMWVPRRERSAVLAISASAMLVPLLLQWLGVVTPFYRFENGNLLVLPHAFQFTETPTLLMLVLSGVGTMVVPSISMHLLRDTLDDAQRQLARQRWTLEQLGVRPRG